jgi:hypothetical protein
MEGSTPSETEEEPTGITSNVSLRGNGSVRTPATRDNFALPLEKKNLNDVENLN